MYGPTTISFLMFIDHIHAVLSDPLPWDQQHHYTPSTIQVKNILSFSLCVCSACEVCVKPAPE